MPAPRSLSAWGIAFFASACTPASDNATLADAMAEQPDAGPPHAMEIDLAHAASLPPPPSACGSNAVTVLASAPTASIAAQSLDLLQQVGGACPRIDPTELSLRNITDHDIEISSLTTTDSHFTATAGELPKRLHPDDRWLVPVSFSSETVGEIHAELVITSDAGCQAYPLKGMTFSADESGVITSSPNVLDFGRVAAGTTSDRTFTLNVQPSSIEPPSTLGGFSISGDGFQLISPPTRSMIDACETIEVGLRFTAPSTPGLSTATLTWDLSSHHHGDVFDALVGLELIGTSTARR